VTVGGQPPLLVGLGLEAARRQAAAQGWQVAEVARTAPPSHAPPGPERVVRQKVMGAGRLALVVVSSIELAGPCSRSAPG